MGNLADASVNLPSNRMITSQLYRRRPQSQPSLAAGPKTHETLRHYMDVYDKSGLFEDRFDEPFLSSVKESDEEPQAIHLSDAYLMNSETHWRIRIYAVSVHCFRLRTDYINCQPKLKKIPPRRSTSKTYPIII